MSTASELARRLANEAEAVCRAYLPNGRRSGRYWTVGNVAGEHGRSLFVKLWGDRAGKWTDAATGQHGDLLDLIQLNNGLSCREAIAEAHKFLNEPELSRGSTGSEFYPAAFSDRASAAARLYALSRPVPGTLAETYLRNRGITARLDWPSLRFHPACYYRAREDAPLERWPTLLAVVTGLDGKLTGLLRTYLARDGSIKAPFADPRRAMGYLLGNAVRFGEPSSVMAAGEGVETVLSLLSLFPAVPMAAGLSAAHLAAILFPPGLRRLYLLRDNDTAGDFAEQRLATRCRQAGIDCRVLKPAANDLNADMREHPPEAVKARMLAQMLSEDRSCFAPG
jgi:hypothetical protein